MTDKIQAFQAVTAAISKECNPEEAKEILRKAQVLLVDMTPTEFEDIFLDLDKRAPLPTKWLRAYRKEVEELRVKPALQAPETGPTLEEELAALRPLAAPLAQCPNILERVVEVLHRRGLAGQVREAKIIYLAVTSRVLNLKVLVNVAVKGPSSGGKSFMVEVVLDMFPESAIYTLSAMSERALAYSQEPLSHRHLVIYEAAGLGSDFAQYLIRSLLSEGHVCYETVEKTKTGLVPRRIEREGPTGFITTTTKTGLHPENETRLLTLEVDDTPEQTKAVLLAHAKGEEPKEVDLAPYKALQRILELEKPQAVVPFAKALAKGCDPTAVRLRRDFLAVLTLVKAHAVLHASLRTKDEYGRVIATLEDYMAVYDLVADLVSYGTGQKVPETIRETVAVVEKLTGGNSDGVTYSAIGKKLAIDESAARRRVQTAIKKGYLANRETKPRRAAKIVIGEPLPDGKHVLPHPKSLSDTSPDLPTDLPTEDDSCDITKCYGRQPEEPTDCRPPTDAPVGSGPEDPNGGQAVGKGSVNQSAYLNQPESQHIPHESVGRHENQEGYGGKVFQHIQPVSPQVAIRQWDAEHQQATAIKLMVKARENDAALSGLLDGKEVEL